jgi:hypothetical protein
MGKLLILKKDPSIFADFQAVSLFSTYACAALYQDDQQYYVVLIPHQQQSFSYEYLFQRWQPYLIASITNIHGSAKTPEQESQYHYVLKQYPIVDLSGVEQFYTTHHSAALDELMLQYCMRYIDYDFIDRQNKLLFVFAKNAMEISKKSLPPLNEFPGADAHPEFLADMQQLVTAQLKQPTNMQLLSCIDNQQQIYQPVNSQVSTAFFQLPAASQVVATPSPVRAQAF